MDPAAGPAVGEQGPDFELRDQHGTSVRLSALRGARNVVLVFYPFAFSSVCSGELRALRDSFPEAGRPDVALLAISADPMFSLRSWADAEDFRFRLLSDFWPHGAVARSYGVFDEKLGAVSRGTFILDKAGVVRWKVISPIPQARDIADYQKALAGLA